MRSILLALAVLATSLAGCADDGPSDEPTDDTFEGYEPAPETGKGLLRGIVIDVNIVPIPDALVAIKGTEMETTSDANGAFQFSNLDPGTYFMQITKPGYNSIQAQDLVEANVKNPEIVRVQLELIPGALPMFVPLSYNLFMSCGFKLANYVFDAGSCDPTGALGIRGQDDSMHVFELDRSDAPTHYQSEILWEANQPLSQGLVTIQCNMDSTSCGSGVGSDRICNVRGASPLVCRVNNDMASEDVPGGGNNFTTIRDNEGWAPVFAVGLYSNCAVQCVIGAVGVGAALDQEVRSYVSLFYNFKPAEDWLFIEQGEHPLPS